MCCMKKFSAYLIAFAAIVLLACNGGSAEATVDEEVPTAPDGHNAQLSIDYEGTYVGLLPCADCEGIETELTLHKDNTYDLSSKYIGKGDGQPFVSTGVFVWRPDGSTIELQGDTDGAFLYFVGENKLWQLDLEGNRVEGALAEKYILEKKLN